MKKLLIALVVLVVVIAAAGAGVVYLSREEATVPIEQTYGPDPTLAEPNPKLLPTVTRRQGDAMAARHHAQGRRRIWR